MFNFNKHVSDPMPEGYKTKCNISYQQWDYTNDLLTAPLEMANARHKLLNGVLDFVQMM